MKKANHRGTRRLSALAAYLLSVLLPGGTAFAQEVAPATSPFGQTGAVDQAELGRIAGRAEVGQYIQAENTSTVSRNTVSGNSVTGTIAFDAQAFQNMNGLSVLSANTGNNVAINSSLNVNVAIRP